MTIPPRFLDELRSRLSVSDVVGKRVRLTRAGREFKACCPFHHEKSPSFYVNDDKGFYHCFGCGAHGSIIDFTMNHDNLSFIEAVENLAALAGMQVPQSSPQDVRRAKEQKSLYTLLDDAARWMEDQLRKPENRDAYHYMLDRGISDEQLHNYRIGYAPADGQAIRRHLLAKDYIDAQMIEVGVLKASSRGTDPYAFFRERIMFPVPDKRGRVVAFGGRILPDHLRPPDRGDYTPPKYINSSDTPLFHKGHMLYGEPHARKAAADGEPVIVVEGYLDVMACAKAGYKGALAPLGTALTEEQILNLWKMIPADEKVPVLCFDGDNAGRRAATRAVERILPHLKPGHSAKIAFLPEGQDPDTLVLSQGVGALKGILDSALNLVDFLWAEAVTGKNFDTPESRAGLSAGLEDAISRIPDREVQHHYRQAIRERMNKAFGGFKPAFRKRGSGAEAVVAPLRRPGRDRVLTAQQALICALINHPYLFDKFEENIGVLVIHDAGLERLRLALIDALLDRPDLDAAALSTHLCEAGLGEEVSLLLNDQLYVHAPFARPNAEPEDAEGGWRRAYAALVAASERAARG